MTSFLSESNPEHLGIFEWFRQTAPNERPTDWIRYPGDLEAWRLNCRPDIEAADHVCEFFETILHHSKGKWAGQNFVLLPWQRLLLRNLFGWYREDGTRRFRKAGIWVPKKNGKSTLLAGLCLYALVADREPGAEVYSCGTDRNQALIVFSEAANMVDASPELSAALHVYRSTNTIIHYEAASKYKALTADHGRNEGFNIHFLSFDELHAQRDDRLFNAVRYGGAARRQPMLVTISTAGEEEESIGYQQYLHAKAVTEGTLADPWFFGCIYEATHEDDWTSPATWAKANPSMGETISVEDFRADFAEATTSGATENAFRRYRLNQWTKQSVRWINMESWDRCGEAYDEESLVGRPCYGGIDLATKRDSTALALVFPPTETDAKWRSLVRFFLPRYEVTADGSTRDSVRDRELRDRAAYYAWSKAGWLTLTDSVTTDYAFVREQIMADQRKFQVLEWAFDPWNASHVVNELINDHGMDNLIEMRQGFASMSAPSKEFDKLVAENLWRHNRNAMLRKQVDSVSISMDPAGNIKPDKKKASYRIDGVVAIVNGLARAILAGDQNSWFQANRLLVLG